MTDIESAVGFDDRVTAYVEAAPAFAQPILKHLRALVHATCGEIEETIKWGRPFFTLRGEIVGNMSAFKQHCSFGLWAPGMSEKLRAEGIESDDASGSFGRICSVDDLPTDAQLAKWLLHACDLARTKGSASSHTVKRPPARAAKGELAIPADFAEKLKTIAPAASFFASLSPSCKKEYVEWIEDAKRPETRARRIAQALAMIGEGKRRNWKYETQ